MFSDIIIIWPKMYHSHEAESLKKLPQKKGFHKFSIYNFEKCELVAILNFTFFRFSTSWFRNTLWLLYLLRNIFLAPKSHENSMLFEKRPFTMQNVAKFSPFLMQNAMFRITKYFAILQKKLCCEIALPNYQITSYS